MAVWERTLENRKRTEHLFSCFLTFSLTVHPIVKLFYKRGVNKQLLYFLALIYLQRITAPDSNSAFFSWENKGSSWWFAVKEMSQWYLLYLVYRSHPLPWQFTDYEKILSLQKFPLCNQTSGFILVCSEKAFFAADCPMSNSREVTHRKNKALWDL